MDEKEKALKGVYRRNNKGFGFVKIDEKTEEIYISRQNSLNSFDGDIVLIKIIGESKEKKSKEGKVLKIISHGKNTIVGTFEFNKNFGFYFINIWHIES